MSKEAIEDRRQRAREAYSDASPTVGNDVIDQVHAAVEIAIEAATRVKVTDEALTCLLYASDTRDAFTAALAELGFEVEE